MSSRPPPPPQLRPLPVAESILWTPVEGGGGGGAATAADLPPYPVFLGQHALGAIHDHFKVAPNTGLLGFLVGDLCESPPPDSGARYIVVDLVIRLPLPIRGDEMTLAISQVWDKLQGEIRKSRRHLLGWYHSHPPMGVALTPGDLEAHRRYFAEPWQCALVLGAEKQGPVGGFFRPARQESGLPIRLPFYEILEAGAVTAEGRYRSRVPWKNYRPHRPPAPPPLVAAQAASAAPTEPRRPAVRIAPPPVEAVPRPQIGRAHV